MTSEMPQDILTSSNQIHGKIPHTRRVKLFARKKHNDGKLSSIFLRCRIVNNGDSFFRHVGDFFESLFGEMLYRSGTVNSNTVNSKFHLIRSCCEYLARFLSFHV